MIERELKINFKSFLTWLIATLVLFLFVFLIYPTIASSDNIESLNQMMQMFPPEILKAFNMDIASIDSAYGWLKSEGFIFVLLILGCYSALLGSNILVKEENDKTIEYLNSLPIKRNNIVLSKVIVSLIYIFSIIILVSLFNFIGLQLSGDFDKSQYLLLSLTPLFICLPLFFICLFISTLTHKTKKMIGISLGIVLGSYILQTFSQIADTTEFLKYFSLFTLADTRNVILNTTINPIIVIISILLSALFLLLTLHRYNKKELV